MVNKNRTNSNDKLKWVERISYLLDEQFKFPETNFRFGLDPLLNIFPIAGSASGFIVSMVLLLTIARYGVSGKLLILLTLNVILDATIGAIPILGTIFDFFYKANSRNIKLLREHYQDGKHQGSGKGILIIILLLMVVFFIVLIFIIWKIFDWVFSYF